MQLSNEELSALYTFLSGEQLVSLAAAVLSVSAEQVMADPALLDAHMTSRPATPQELQRAVEPVQTQLKRMHDTRERERKEKVRLSKGRRSYF